ncbi:MAG: recombinase RecT [Synergistaceae bacterium]|nr:recombinase RecT [Synergistaceae bacterium]
MEQRAIAKTETAPAVQWSRDEVETIRRTVADGATDSELKMFLHLSQTYGLDPFAKDLWFIKAGGRPVIMTSRDGYLKIANRDPHFAGMDADVVYSGDSFRKTQQGVEHIYGTKDRGQPVGAYATVYRDDRKIPVYVYAPFKDYNKGGGTWRQYPHAMILKVAEAMALKRAFSISGLVTREEMDEGDEPAPMVSCSEKPNSSSRRAAELWKRYLEGFGGDAEAAKTVMQRIAPKPSKSWTEDDFVRLEKYLEDKLIREEIGEAGWVKESELIDAEAVTEETPPEPDHSADVGKMITENPAATENEQS